VRLRLSKSKLVCVCGVGLLHFVNVNIVHVQWRFWRRENFEWTAKQRLSSSLQRYEVWLDMDVTYMTLAHCHVHARVADMTEDEQEEVAYHMHIILMIIC
jgi:hypothetical protein